MIAHLYFAGVIPGTRYVLPSNIMLGLFVMALIFVGLYALATIRSIYKAFYNLEISRDTNPRRLPKRRYQQI